MNCSARNNRLFFKKKLGAFHGVYFSIAVNRFAQVPLRLYPYDNTESIVDQVIIAYEHLTEITDKISKLVIFVTLKSFGSLFFSIFFLKSSSFFSILSLFANASRVFGPEIMALLPYFMFRLIITTYHSFVKIATGEVCISFSIYSMA